MARRKRKRKRWIQHALRFHKKGVLHRQLGVPVGESIPLSLLREAAEAPGKMGYRARLALTLRKIQKKRR